MLLLVWACSFSWVRGMAEAPQGLRIALATDGCPQGACEALRVALHREGADVEMLAEHPLKHALEASSVDAVVFPDAPRLSPIIAPAYFAFAKRGGHLVLLGGMSPT